jgi:hypothetical protein
LQKALTRLHWVKDNSGMLKEKKREEAVAVVLIVGAMLILLFPLYMLSIGPSLWLVTHGYLSPHVHNEVYTPWAWTYENVPTIQPALNAHNRLWLSGKPAASPNSPAGS